MLTTASLAVSKQMLHSNIESSFFEPFVSSFCLSESVASKLLVVSVRFDVLPASNDPFKLSLEFVLNSLAALFGLLCEFVIVDDDDDDDDGAVSGEDIFELTIYTRYVELMQIVDWISVVVVIFFLLCHM